MTLTGIIKGLLAPENHCPLSAETCSTGQLKGTSGGGSQWRLKKEEKEEGTCRRWLAMEEK